MARGTSRARASVVGLGRRRSGRGPHPGVELPGHGSTRYATVDEATRDTAFERRIHVHAACGPQLDAGGVPGDVALVDGKGPPDLDGLPFAGLFVRDAAGACVQQPVDIGAFEVP